MARTPGPLAFKPMLPDSNEPDLFGELTRRERRRELLIRIVRTVIALGVVYVASLIFFARPLLLHIARPYSPFDIYPLTFPLPLYLKTAFYIALGGAMPVLVSQFADLLAPAALTTRATRFVIASLPVMVLLYADGALLAVSHVAPRVIAFL